jgi:hypothetical protein
MSLFDEIIPATPDKVNMYAVYMKSPAKRSILPKAITLFYKGGLGGFRSIEGGEKIPYVMNWDYNLNLPADQNRCTMMFDENADLTYDIKLANADLIGFLIDWLVNIRDTNSPDFPLEFYRKLMRLED